MCCPNYRELITFPDDEILNYANDEINEDSPIYYYGDDYEEGGEFLLDITEEDTSGCSEGFSCVNIRQCGSINGIT